MEYKRRFNFERKRNLFNNFYVFTAGVAAAKATEMGIPKSNTGFCIGRDMAHTKVVRSKGVTESFYLSNK